MSEPGDSGRRPFRVVPAPVPAPAEDDAALVAAFLVGDDRAFESLVRRNEDLLLRVVRRWARSPDDARDLAQRAFLRAFEAARRGVARGRRGPFPFRRWLVRIAVNLAKNHARDEARWPRAPLDHAGPSGAAPADAALADAEARARVRRAVAGLPRRQREVLSLRLDAELPFGEIADALGITENAAKVSFHYATRRLRAAVEEDGS